MKHKTYIKLNLLLLFFIIGCNQNKILKSNANIKEQLAFETNPNKAVIVTSDIKLFWEVFDKVIKDTVNLSFQEYLDRGSQGVMDFIPDQRIVSAEELKKLVLAEKQYYNNIRNSTLKILSYKKQIRATYYALKYLYPEAVFPPLYFIVGRTTSGATATENGLVVASEVFADKPYKTNYGRPTIDLDLLPFIVAHEMVHFLQKNDSHNNSLLKQCIREGSADFIAEMTAGEKVKLINGVDLYSYGDANEAKLWEEFNKVMYQDEYTPWLYSQTTNNRPQNLGYWMGYKIVESYYNNAKDKQKAIEDIINIRDYNQFLIDSKYQYKHE